VRHLWERDLSDRDRDRDHDVCSRDAPWGGEEEEEEFLTT
jgi:hypothetical protein